MQTLGRHDQFSSDKVESSRHFVEERNEKEAILESLIEGVIVLDSTGIVRHMNHTAANMLAIPRRQLVGKPLLPHDNHPKIELFKQCYEICRLASEQGSVVTDSISMEKEKKSTSI